MGQRILPHSQLNKKKDTDFSAEFYNVAKIVKKVLDFPSYKNQLIYRANQLTGIYVVVTIEAFLILLNIL